MDKYMPVIMKFAEPVLTLVIGLIVIKVLLAILRKFLLKSKIDIALHKFLTTITTCILGVILILVLLEKLNIDTKSMITMLGVAGGAIALALKDSLGNVAGGIIILLTKPFANGDYVDIDGTEGTVEHIDMFITTLKTIDNKTITMPNGLVTSAVVTNFTRADMRRVDCVFGIAYSADIAKVKDLLRDIADSNPMIFQEPEPVIGVINHGDNAVNIDCKVWTKTEDYWTAKYYLEENVKLAFDREGVEIPFPQMDVHIREK